MNRIALATACCIALASTIARADWTLTSADAPEQKRLTINTWDAIEGLSATTPAGILMKIDTRSVVSLSAGKEISSSPTPGAWRLTLRNGDLLLGQPAGMSGQSLRFAVPELGTINVPLKAVVMLTDAKQGGLLKAGSDKDIVHFNNGDTMEGIVANVLNDKLQIATGADSGAGATTDIAMNLINTILFAGATPPRGVPPLSARVTFLSGTILTIPLDAASHFSWTINDLTLADPSGESHRVPAEQIASIDVLGGRVVSLTDLDPATDEQTSFLGTPWPTSVNKNVLGGPLMVGKSRFLQGLGVHTHSAIAYELDGSFDTLKLQVGIDDTAAPRGMADVSILLDGKILWHQESLTAAIDAPAQSLSLPIKGGKHLELHADSPKARAGLDILGRVDWLSPTLVRP